MEGLLQTYSTFGFEYEGLSGEYYTRSEKIYDNTLFNPYFGDMWNESEEISFDYFLGIYEYEVYVKTVDFPIFTGLVAFGWVLVTSYLIRRQILLHKTNVNRLNRM